MPPTDLPSPPLPRRVRVTEPGVYAVEYGADQRLAAQVRRWVWAASRMSREQADSLIEVTNQGPLGKAGRVRMADGATETGNGLRLVKALSCEWGATGGVDGHTVRAHLPQPRRRSERARVMFQAAS